VRIFWLLVGTYLCQILFDSVEMNLDLLPPIHDTILRCDPLLVSSRQHELWTMKGLIIGLDFSVLIFMLLKPSYCIQAVRNICAPEPHFVPNIVRTKLTRESFTPVFFQMWFIGKRSVQSHPKKFRVLSNWTVSFPLASCAPK
jgi:hypothetical protein